MLSRLRSTSSGIAVALAASLCATGAARADGLGISANVGLGGDKGISADLVGGPVAPVADLGEGPVAPAEGPVAAPGAPVAPTVWTYASGERRLSTDLDFV